MRDFYAWATETEKDIETAGEDQTIAPISPTTAGMIPVGASFPASNYATLDTRNTRPVLDFDATTQETVYFTGTLHSGYAGGGLTIKLWWSATTAVTGTIGFDVSIEQVTGLDSDTDSFAAAQTVTAATVPATSGEVALSTVAIADGAAMDSLAAGDLFRLRIRRDVATDTATGDAELHMVEVDLQ